VPDLLLERCRRIATAAAAVMSTKSAPIAKIVIVTMSAIAPRRTPLAY